MKTRNLFLLLSLIALVFTSCVDDDILDPNEDARDILVGSWNCVESSAKIAYTVHLSKDPANTDQLLMENFAYIGSGEFASGVLNGTNITIPEQVPCDDYLVSGSGVMVNHNRLTWTYSVTAGGDKMDYTAVFTR